LLDEPTNHLDLRAKDVLLNALQDFNGTVVFVSHDRYFIDKLATRVFEVGEGKVEVFPGNYEDYLWRKQGGVQAQSGTATLGGEFSATNSQQSSATNGGLAQESEPKQKRMNPIKLRQMKERLAEVEEEITKLETGIAECEQALQTFVSAQETARVTELLETRRSDLKSLMQEWENVSELIAEE
jgi:ATP-binding cassette subfamily F protein 3